MQKLYCYLDETGQDTQGVFFLVSIAIFAKSKVEILEQRLLEIEQLTGKRQLKWTGTPFAVRVDYLQRIAKVEGLEEALFYSVFSNSTDYALHKSQTLISVIKHKASRDYKANIFIDGLDDQEKIIIRKHLKAARIRYRTIRGLSDESSVFIRLCDALAGFLRDYEEGNPYTVELFRDLQRNSLIQKL